MLVVFGSFCGDLGGSGAWVCYTMLHGKFLSEGEIALLLDTPEKGGWNVDE
jgi:hypothetical protein